MYEELYAVWMETRAYCMNRVPFPGTVAHFEQQPYIGDLSVWFAAIRKILGPETMLEWTSTEVIVNGVMIFPRNETR